jgi:ADP-ribose pyrophosphatase YjhB (NUDIX family)
MASDISYKITDQGKAYRFNYRVGAIIKKGDLILIHKFMDADFSFLPGGRVQLGESAEAALRRELQEELQVEAVISGVPFVAENLFQNKDEAFHELSFYFEVDGSNLSLPQDGEIRGKVQFFWRTHDDMAALNLKPNFLRDKLHPLPTTTKHILFIEGGFKG